MTFQLPDFSETVDVALLSAGSALLGTLIGLLGSFLVAKLADQHARKRATKDDLARIGKCFIILRLLDASDSMEYRDRPRMVAHFEQVWRTFDEHTPVLFELQESAEKARSRALAQDAISHLNAAVNASWRSISDHWVKKYSRRPGLDDKAEQRREKARQALSELAESLR